MALPRIAAQPNPASAIKTQLAAALATNRTIVTQVNTFLAIPTPTQNQTNAAVQQIAQAVKALAQQNIGIARLLSNTLDGTG